MSPATLLLPVAAAVVATVGLHLLALWLFPKLGLLDFPERYGLTRKRLPYPSGILAMIVFVAAFPALETMTMQAWGLLLAVVLLGVSSFVDDRYRLPPALRLGVQVVLALLLFATGTRIYSFTNPLDILGNVPVLPLDTWVVTVPPFGSLPVWSGLFTVFWVCLTVNALNWFDGIPGQTSTISAFGFLTIGLLSLSGRVDQPEIARLAFVLAGIAGACVLFDFPPPRVVLGDSGAMFFGLMLGVLTIYAGGKVATAFLALGVPLVDAVAVGIRRILQGRAPWKGTQGGDHLHHRLLACGWSPRRIIALTALLGIAFGGTALFLSTGGKVLAGALLTAIVLGLSWRANPGASRRNTR